MSEKTLDPVVSYTDLNRKLLEGLENQIAEICPNVRTYCQDVTFDPPLPVKRTDGAEGWVVTQGQIQYLASSPSKEGASLGVILPEGFLVEGYTWVEHLPAHRWPAVLEGLVEAQDKFHDALLAHPLTRGVVMVGGWKGRYHRG